VPLVDPSDGEVAAPERREHAQRRKRVTRRKLGPETESSERPRRRRHEQAPLREQREFLDRKGPLGIDSVGVLRAIVSNRGRAPDGISRVARSLSSRI